MRADARRNYLRLVEVASQAFIRDGTEASLEDIARTAGVGIGTLYRHFPTRRALVQAVLDQGRLDLEARARELRETAPPEEALLVWVRGWIRHTARYRGLAREYLVGIQGGSDELKDSCESLRSMGRDLLERAQAAGAFRPDMTVDDLIKFVSAISWIAECSPDGEADVDRLLELTLDGLRVR
ncbi:TetR/AcrR family transcriptional regulator [Nonomuraea sp. NPDC050536]|uniref:TetR/AcrR family transcriptional regulator n=1 Tax=Nonomuraea sp. NPDC050536 TaxID=3364366 RepID=UPI0037CB2BB2